MTVTLQLSRQKDVVSDGIAEWTRSWPSHVDIVWPDGQLLGARSDVCLGVPAGVQLRPSNYAAFTQTERVTFTGGHDTLFYAFLEDQIGKPYDKWAVIGLALDRDWRHTGKWFCSELAMAALEIGEYVKKISSPVSFISPRDILILGETCGQPA